MDKEYILKNLSTLSVEEIVKAILAGVVTFEEILHARELLFEKINKVRVILEELQHLEERSRQLEYRIRLLQEKYERLMEEHPSDYEEIKRQIEESAYRLNEEYQQLKEERRRFGLFDVTEHFDMMDSCSIRPQMSLRQDRRPMGGFFEDEIPEDDTPETLPLPRGDSRRGPVVRKTKKPRHGWFKKIMREASRNFYDMLNDFDEEDGVFYNETDEQTAITLADKVFSAVYAPSSAELNKWFKVQVHLYKESEADRVDQKARKMDEKARLSEYNPLNMPIKRGTQVDAEIQVYDDGVRVAKTTRSLTWNGELTSAVFQVKAVDPYLHSVAGDVVLSVNGVLLGEFSFNTDIVTSPLLDIKYELSQPKRFSKAFISYSHKDVETAEFAANMLKTLGIEYFFDHHSLETGSVFDEEIMRQIEESDVFYLFWSQNAAESDYVEKEYTHAAQFAYPQKQPKSAATLVFKPFIIEPRPQGFPAALSEYTFSEMPHKH